jgi:hypothetical protein
MSHLRHTSDRTCNAKAWPNNGVQPTGNSVRSCLAPAIPSG